MRGVRGEVGPNPAMPAPMPEILELADVDFASQMRGLSREASQALEDRAETSRQVNIEAEAARELQERAIRVYQSLPQMLRPLVQGVEAVTRATGENTQALSRLEGAAKDVPEAENKLPQIVADLQTLADHRNSVSRDMFNALHEELRTYKDGFLLEAIHRPMIRDLISLYDDLVEAHRQMLEIVVEGCSLDGDAAHFGERCRAVALHIEHRLEFILEVLARLDVDQMPIGYGKLDKRTQRAVAVETADVPEEDGLVLRAVKRGFFWKDRIARPEEVVIKKWKEGCLIALKAPLE